MLIEKVWGMRARETLRSKSKISNTQLKSATSIELGDKARKELEDRIKLAQQGLREDKAKRVAAQIIKAEEKRQQAEDQLLGWLLGKLVERLLQLSPHPVC